MNPTFGVVLPVYNAEDHLLAQVQSVLDVVSELSSRFEILIVDDASTDQTEEVASEIATLFPQVRVIRHPFRKGFAAACRTGLLHTRGEMIFVQEPDLPVSSSELRQFWFQSGNQTTAADPQPLQSGLIHRLHAWASALASQYTVGQTAVHSPATEKLAAAEKQGTSELINSDSAHPLSGPITVRRAATRPQTS